MKRIYDQQTTLYGTVLLLCLICVWGCQKSASPVALTDAKLKKSYSLGMQVSTNLKAQGLPIETEAFLLGFRDEREGVKSRLSEEDQKNLMAEIQQDMAKIGQERAKEEKENWEKLGAKNKEESEKFLATNKTKQGVTVLPSGLQYEVIKAGEGLAPTLDERVVVNYRGFLLNGQEFDSSFKRGSSATLPLNAVIPGLAEALMQMKEGARWKLYIPPHLGYGEKGVPPTVGPNETLIFDLELVAIAKR